MVQAFDAPLDAAAIDGEVVLTAPRGAASIALTPQAALVSAERIEAAAHTAIGQEREVQPGDPADA